MRRHPVKTGWQIATVVVLCFPLIAAQRKPAVGKSIPPQVPQLDIRLSPQTDVSFSLSNDVSESSIDCDADGNPYVGVFRYNSLQILGFTSNGVITFTSDKMTDIPSPTIQGFFVGSSEVYILARGVENATTEETTLSFGEGHDVKVNEVKGEEVRYIARFDRDGSYRGAFKLDLKLNVFQVAAFDSGTFLAEGIDGNKAPRVALLNSGGEIVGYIHLPKDITDDTKPAKYSSSPPDGQPKPEDYLDQAAQLSHSNGNVLLVRMGGKSAIYEIRDSSAVRAVRIKIPDSSAAKLLIPSDRNWFVDLTSDIFVHESSVIYEISPENGEPLRKYLLEKKSGREDQIACQFQGTFTGIRHEKGVLTLLTGTAEPAKVRGQERRAAVSH